MGRERRGPLQLAVLLAVAAASVAETRAQPPAPVVRAVEWRCEAPIDRAGLQRMLPFAVGEPLGPGALERARTLLEETGIFAAVAVAGEVRDDGVVVRVDLVRRPVVNLLRIRGNATLSQAAVYRLMRVRENALLHASLLDESLERIRREYRNQGFETARVEAIVVPQGPGEVDLTIRIDEGPPTRIAAIGIESPVPLPVAESELRAALGLRPGDRRTRDGERAAVRRAVEFLRARQYLEASVRPRWEASGPAAGTLSFRIDPGPRVVVEMQGNRALGRRTLLGLVDVRRRTIVTGGTWRELAGLIRQRYQDAGFYFARVELELEPGDPTVVRFRIDEGDRYRVRRVRFEGQTGLPAARLRREMATGRRGLALWRRPVLRDDVLDEDVERLGAVYRRNGYLEAAVRDRRLAFDAARGTVDVTLVVDAGPRTTVRAVERAGFDVSGDPLPPLRTRTGLPLDPDGVEADRAVLQQYLAQRGFEQAVVTADVVPAPEAGEGRAATVRFLATPGPQVRVGTVVVQNAVDTRWSLVQRHARVVPGAPLDEAALLRAQARLFRLGLFRSVTVRPLDSGPAPGTRDVGISVSERPPGSLQWGGGYNTRDGLRMFGEVAATNLQGLGRRLSLRGDFSILPGRGFEPDQYIGTLGYRAPLLFDTEWTGRATLLANRSTRSVDQFSIERFALVPALERPLPGGLIAGIDYLAERSLSFDLAPPVVRFNPRDAEWMWTFGPGPFLLHDTRDDPFLPRRGVLQSLTTRVALAELGASVPFASVVAQHAQHVPLSGEVGLVYALRGGYAHALAGAGQVPIRERFFLGGRTTVRGFAENSIGPAAGRERHPLGGDLMANVNVELRFPLVWGFAGAVFGDGGGVYLQRCRPAEPEQLENCGITLDNFRRSAGLGLRYLTPVGPLSVDYGVKLDRRRGESFGEIHFSVGNIF